MGPGVGGLGAVPLPRWRDRLERTWGVRVVAPEPALDPSLARCIAAWERGLRAIEFPEVTDQDRATFLEHVIRVQVDSALRAGRFDLALELRVRGARRVFALLAGERRWRPILLRGGSWSEHRRPDA